MWQICFAKMRTRLQGTGGVLTFRLRVFWSGVDGGAGELAQPFAFAFLFGDTLFLAFGLGDGFALAALFFGENRCFAFAFAFCLGFGVAPCSLVAAGAVRSLFSVKLYSILFEGFDRMLYAFESFWNSSVAVDA